MSASADGRARPRVMGAADPAALWRDLVLIRARCPDEREIAGTGSSQSFDPWASRARDYDARVARRWSEPDSTRGFILAQLIEGGTLLDIGAGTGAWSMLAAEYATHVTAVERSPAMLRVLEENLAARGIANVSVVAGSWPEVAVEPHDFSLCAHAMYWTPDLPSFIRRMIACTRRMCFFVVRAPSPKGIMAEAARHIWGHSIDSPNLTLADGVLRQMGLRPRLLRERGGLRQQRQSASLDDALGRMKRHLGVCDTTEHDDYFEALLHRRLVYEGGCYLWPPDDGSALIYWTVE